MASRKIRINHVEAVENYLKVDQELRYIDLEMNVGVRGVSRLIADLPKSFEPKDIKKFYKKTGLKVQIQVMKDCDMFIYDRKGKYPRDDAYIWNEHFVKGVKKHPEWLEPQEEADIIIVYKINPVEVKMDNLAEEDDF